MIDRFEADRSSFAWRIPDRFNIARAVVDRHDPDALALIQVAADGKTRDWRFGEIARASSRLRPLKPQSLMSQPIVLV
jgi:acyl-coenzyme A synthetase/AMP-(fatty) acid ligase